MKINLEQLKALVEAGDTSAIEKHILNDALEKTDVYGVLEKGDIVAAAAVNAEVKSELDSEKDKHHTKAFAKFEAEKLPNLLNAAKDEVRKELNPEETSEQKEIRELRELFTKEKQKTARAEVRSKLIELATSEEVGLDAVFVAKHIDKFIPSTFEVGEDNEINTQAVIDTVKSELTNLSTDFKSVVSKEVENAMKSTARTDIGGVGGTGQEQRSFAQELAQDIKAQQQTKSKDSSIFYKSN